MEGVLSKIVSLKAGVGIEKENPEGETFLTKFFIAQNPRGFLLHT